MSTDSIPDVIELKESAFLKYDESTKLKTINSAEDIRTIFLTILFCMIKLKYSENVKYSKTLYIS